MIIRVDSRHLENLDEVASRGKESRNEWKRVPWGSSEESLSSSVIRRIKGVWWNTMGSRSKPRLVLSFLPLSLPLLSGTRKKRHGTPRTIHLRPFVGKQLTKSLARANLFYASYHSFAISDSSHLLESAYIFFYRRRNFTKWWLESGWIN